MAVQRPKSCRRPQSSTVFNDAARVHSQIPYPGKQTLSIDAATHLHTHQLHGGAPTDGDAAPVQTVQQPKSQERADFEPAFGHILKKKVPQARPCPKSARSRVLRRSGKESYYAPSIAVLHECPRVGNLVAQLGAKDKENKKGAAVALRLMMMMMPKMASVAEE